MARLIYACRFEILTESGLKLVSDAYSAWIQSHYRERRKLVGFELDISTGGSAEQLPDRHSLTVETFAGSTAKVTRVQWSYPADSDSGLEWKNYVRFGAFGNRCSIEHLISIDSTDYRVAPAQFALGSPSVIRKLCSNAPAHVGEMQVKATVYPVTQNSVGEFLGLLRSPFRRLPIVFVSPYASGEPNQLDVVSLARNLAGVGVVISASDAEATWEIADNIGRTLSCFDGGARIYWPGFSTEQHQHVHRLFLGARISEIGGQTAARYIERSIFAVAAFRFVPDQRIDEAIAQAQHAQRIQRVEGQKSANGDEWEKFALELDEQLSMANEEIANLRAENKNLKDNQQVFLSTRFDGESEIEEGTSAEGTAPPDTVDAAVETAVLSCSNLIVLPSAREAAKDSPFQRPDEVLSALRDLDLIAADSARQRKATGSGGDILQHLKNRGWGKRSSMHISNTSKTSYRSDYEFEYDGKRQLFEPHITLGSGDANSCASIHFIVDHAREKIVVGHVGRHLTNTKT